MMAKYFVIFVLALVLTGLAYDQSAFAGAYDDLDDVYQDTSAFDGGPGSTINTSPAAYDSDRGYDPYSVPDVGEGVPVE